MSETKDDVICYCTGTTKEKIMELIAQGMNDLDRISRETGACSGCGSCDAEINNFLAEHSSGI